MKQKKQRREKGQATLEFLVIGVVFLFFIFFFVHLAVVFMISSYIDYSVFMGSRSGAAAAYSISDTGSDNNQQDNLTRTVSTFLRSDSTAQTGAVASDQSFFHPFVRLFSSDSGEQYAALEAPQTVNPEVLGAQHSMYRPRIYGVNFTMSHLFFLGSFLIPGLEGLSNIDSSGVYHVFRREPTSVECRETMDYISNRRFGIQGEPGGLFDDGC